MGRPVTLNVGPLATADDDGAATAQKVAASLFIALNGALTDGSTANNICQSQTPAGAGNLTLDGTLCSGSPAVAYLGQNSRAYIVCAGNESGRTFTFTGLAQNAQGLYAVTETLTGANVSTVATQKLYYSISSIAVDAATAGALTVGRAGTATFDTARRVIATSGGNDSGITFAIVGTDINGSPQSESFAGTNGSVASSVLSYKTVTSFKPSAAVATTVKVGTNGVADSPWVRFDDYGALAEVAIQASVTGTVNYTVRQTLQDPNAPYPDTVAPASIVWVDHPDSAVVAATATAQANYQYPPLFAKVVLNSGTGSVSTVFRQVGALA